jgi:DNA-binding IclR family transcriptional regulator
MLSVTRKLDATGHDSGPYKVQVLDRAIAILELLSHSSGEMSLGQLTSEIGLHKSTVHRLLMVMQSHRLVERSSTHGSYRLGMRLFELGNQAAAGLDLRELARPRLEWLVANSGESVHLFVMDHGEMLYIDKHEPERSVRISTRIGQRTGAHCSAAGKAMLAFMTEAQVLEVLGRHGLEARTPTTIITTAALMAELVRTRERDYALDNEENEAGVRCVAAAIRNEKGEPVAAISISGPAFRFSQQSCAEMAQHLRMVARELSVARTAPRA